MFYAIYIIGYTFQTACTKSGQTVLTNDPNQRLLFSTFGLSYTPLFFSGAPIYVSNYLEPKYGGFTEGFFSEFVITILLIAGLLTFLAVTGVWKHDRTENFGTGGKQANIGFKDMYGILKGNRALQMLIVAAATDKLALTVANNAIVMVLLFGVVIGDYGLYGQVSAYTMIPSLLIIQVGTRYARKLGSKKALVTATWACIIVYSALFALLLLGDPTQISFDNMGFMTIAFSVLYILGNGIKIVSGGIVIPMIPDITDYETYKNRPLWA